MQTDAKILHSIKNKHLWITSIAISDSIAFEDAAIMILRNPVYSSVTESTNPASV